jgi:hypothetical protein
MSFSTHDDGSKRRHRDDRDVRDRKELCMGAPLRSHHSSLVRGWSPTGSAMGFSVSPVFRNNQHHCEQKGAATVRWKVAPTQYQRVASWGAWWVYDLTFARVDTPQSPSPIVTALHVAPRGGWAGVPTRTTITHAQNQIRRVKQDASCGRSESESEGRTVRRESETRTH